MSDVLTLGASDQAGDQERLAERLRAAGSRRAAQLAQNRWLPRSRRGPMPWIIAIMTFLTLLAAAAGLALGHGLTSLQGDLRGGYTVQLVEPDPARRAAQVRQVAALLRRDRAVRAVAIVPEAQLRDQLAPWIGTDGNDDTLPIPALIDVTVAADTPPARIAAMEKAIRAIAPQARLDPHESYLAPVVALMRLLMGLAAGLVALMILVTTAVVMLAARSAHDAHRDTIDIMHGLGATDRQITRLFQRRTGLDALFGGLVGLALAAPVVFLLGQAIDRTGSDLTGMIALPWHLAALLPLLPLLGGLIAMLTARITVRRALERTL